MVGHAVATESFSRVLPACLQRCPICSRSARDMTQHLLAHMQLYEDLGCSSPSSQASSSRSLCPTAVSFWLSPSLGPAVRPAPLLSIGAHTQSLACLASSLLRHCRGARSCAPLRGMLPHGFGAYLKLEVPGLQSAAGLPAGAKRGSCFVSTLLWLLQEWAREEEALLKAKHAVMASSSLQMPAVSSELLAATAPY